MKSFITDCNDTTQYYFDIKLLSSRYNVLATALQTEIFTLQACLGNEEEMVRKSSTNSKTLCIKHLNFGEVKEGSI